MSNLRRIAVAQMDITLGDSSANLAAMSAKLHETSGQDVLTVFPECALSGYCFDSKEEAWPHAESIPGPATEAMAQACGRAGGFAVFGMLEQAGDDLFNACVLVGPDGLIGNYRKIHLPYLGIDRFTTPGDLGFPVYEVNGMRVGMSICYDGAFPEAAHCLALDGADLIVLPTNWPPGAECTANFVINTRAMENHVYHLSADRVGDERGFHFIGLSKICDPTGGELASAPHDRPALLIADIDVDFARRKKVVRVPDRHVIDRFADRRPSTYGAIIRESK